MLEYLIGQLISHAILRQISTKAKSTLTLTLKDSAKQSVQCGAKCVTICEGELTIKGDELSQFQGFPHFWYHLHFLGCHHHFLSHLHF